MFSDFDHAMMRHALTLAEEGLFTATPNPCAKCVIVRDDTVVDEGYTQPVGQDHAEIQTVKDTQSRDQDVHGATAHVVLEPCSHFGRTPPCTDRLVEAGIARVVATMEDPSPVVSGRGPQKLHDAGMDIRCGLLEHEARELNIGFVSRMTRGTSWMRVKVGASLDGHTALDSGVSQRITEAEVRNSGHRQRARACAVLTGIGTVYENNPRLTVRAVNTPRQPRRVLVDSALDMPLDAHILTVDGRHKLTLVLAARPEAGRMWALSKCGAEVILLPSTAGKADLAAILHELGRHEVNELHVETGFKPNSSLLREKLVDEILICLAPKVLNSGQGMFNMESLQTLEGAAEFFFHDISRIGGDLRILARRDLTDWLLMFIEIVVAVDRAEIVPPFGDNADAGVRLSIDVGGLPLADMASGDSTAIQGACMTIVTKANNRFEVGMSHESLSKTAGLESPGEVDLERALRLADHIGGHLVSGHVGGLGMVTHFTPVNESHELHVQTPTELGKYLACEGPVVVSDISSTVNTVHDDTGGYEFSINLILHTVAVTTLKHLKASSQVNLEIDLIARYVERMLTHAAIGLPVDTRPLATV